MQPRRLCEKSILWVLKYRDAPGEQMRKMYRYGFVDNHTAESWKWTKKEARVIEKMGIDHWLLHMDGPLGFDYYKRNSGNRDN